MGKSSSPTPTVFVDEREPKHVVDRLAKRGLTIVETKLPEEVEHLWDAEVGARYHTDYECDVCQFLREVEKENE